MLLKNMSPDKEEQLTGRLGPARIGRVLIWAVSGQIAKSGRKKTQNRLTAAPYLSQINLTPSPLTAASI